MNADPQLRLRLDRAAGHVQIDVDQRLDEIYRSAPRRRRRRRVAALTIAAVVGLASLAMARELLHLASRTTTPGTSVQPSGKIAYMRLTKPLDQADASDLFAVDAASTEVTALHEGTGFSAWPQWSPDGSRFAFASNETEQRRIGIFVAGTDGTEPVNILEGRRSLGEGGPISLSWSPDGARIAFVGRDFRTGRTGVWTVRPDGTDERTVLAGHWEAVSWSPDGSRLLLAGVPASAKQFDLYTVRLDGSGLLQLTDDELVERAPSWSPNGTRIVFAERTVAFQNEDYGQDVFVIAADGSSPRQLTHWEGFDSFPIWSPDGKWLAFASDRDATPEQQSGNRGNRPFGGISIYVMPTDGSHVMRLLEGDAVALLPSAWKP
jgi:Tol biopolymer transport system component